MAFVSILYWGLDFLGMSCFGFGFFGACVQSMNVSPNDDLFGVLVVSVYPCFASVPSNGVKHRPEVFLTTLTSERYAAKNF
jgi:hypothetical protein